MILDGAREIDRAVRGGVRLIEVFYAPELLADPSQQTLELAAFASAEIVPVSAAVLEKLAFGDRREGIVAVAQTPRALLEEIQLPDRPLVAVLEGVEKPGNVGAVLRSADAAGLSALVVADPQTDLYNPNAIRASLGTIFTLPVAAATGPQTLAWLRRHNLAIFAARVDGSIVYTQADFSRPAAIVLGSEAQGLSDVWRGDDIQAVRLPMLGAADSLNVSATAAVLFYEALRQRG